VDGHPTDVLVARPKELGRSQSMTTPLKNWLNRRLLEPLLALLRQGMSPQRLALCIAIAIVVGNIPILGVSTIICSFVALIFRMNLPTILLVQGAMGPTQVLLIIPFVRLGEWILRVPPQVVSIKAALGLMSQGVWQAVVVLRDAIFHAGLAWALTAPFCVYMLHRLLTPVFERLAAQVRRPPTVAPYPRP
jgi:uncharacterized protein (DUF2062 family)